MKLYIDNRIVYDCWVGTKPGEWVDSVYDFILEQLQAQMMGWA